MYVVICARRLRSVVSCRIVWRWPNVWRLCDLSSNVCGVLIRSRWLCVFFFFQAEDGIRDVAVTGVQTCALPISEAAFGHVDILVNNAGCNVRKPALEVTWEDWNVILDTNLRGSFFASQAVARGMIARGYGRIINIGSVTSVAGYAGLAPYGASRGGIRQLTMSLADDWGKYGVTVNCLAPGWFRTEQNKILYEDKEWVEYLCDRIPLKRPGQPQDLDAAVVFLAAESSRYITGQTLLVDGGISTGATRALVESGKAGSEVRDKSG